MSEAEQIDVSEGSGNVFADLGLPDADELYAKATLSIIIGRMIRDRGLTQAGAAKLLGTTQPKVSDLMRGRLGGFSMERLFRYLNALGMRRPFPRGRRWRHRAPGAPRPHPGQRIPLCFRAGEYGG